MTDTNCENIRIAAMAQADGEESPLGTEEIKTHLSNCERCGEELEELQATNKSFSSQKRLRHQTDLWPLLSERIQATAISPAPFRWRVLVLFGIPLFGYKILMLILQAAPSPWSKLVTVILVIGVFSYLRTNPFKINSKLTLEGETT
jgi:anti-sigma factor RsiW